ncbi:MAG: type II secretion system protein [Phycisphaerales bacterium]
MNHRNSHSTAPTCAPACASARAGFTLVELLVVVSIIALLIGILLPSVGEVRRQARIGLCTANMKQHGQAASNYAASNKDNLPHVPLSNGKGQAGPVGSIGRYFGSALNPTNGVTFAEPGIPTMTGIANSDTLRNSQYFSNAQAWNAYWVFLSEFAVDGAGTDVMQEMFISPSEGDIREEWKRTRQWVSNRASTGSGNTNGFWTLGGPEGTQTIGDPDVEPYRPKLGSYRYVHAAMTDHRVYGLNTRGTPTLGNGVTPQTVNLGSSNATGFASYVRRNTVASVDYPSQKVVFFLWNAAHNKSAEMWCDPSATSTVALGDGSARAVIAQREALPFEADAVRRFESSGPYGAVNFTPEGEEASGAAVEGRYTWFFLTVGGIKGRDL